jgi:hypothetical protein
VSLSFPQATENLQWGDDLCFKIGGGIFLAKAPNNSHPIEKKPTVKDKIDRRKR